MTRMTQIILPICVIRVHLRPVGFRLLRRAGCVVYHKRRLQRRILHTEEVDTNRLSLERSQIESLQRVASRLVQVRVSGKS